jgi:hypothetical protein
VLQLAELFAQAMKPGNNVGAAAAAAPGLGHSETLSQIMIMNI